MLQVTAPKPTPLINNLFDSANEGEGGSDAAKPDLSSIFFGGIAGDEDESTLQGPKLYLLKLIEFNKIAVLEKFGGSASGISGQGDLFDDEQ